MRIIKPNDSETEAFNTLFNADKQFKNYVEWRSNHINDFEDDVQDIFSYMRNSSPKVENADSKPLLNEFINQKHSDLIDMKTRSTGNDILSYISTKAACKLYDEIIDNKLMKSAEDAMKKAESLRTKEEQSTITKAKNQMKLAVRKAIPSYKNEFDEAENALMAIAVAGSDPNSSPKHLNAKDAMEFLKKMKSNATVAEIMKLVGKFQNIATHKLLTTHDGVQSIIGIKLGDDIPRLLPTEMGMLVDADFESLKSLQLLQRQLFQYKYKARTPKNGGPFVACIDESGSMAGKMHANSKAFLFGLWQVAKAESRDLIVVRFGGKNEYETKVIKTIDDMLNVAEEFINSGSTDFETPLSVAKNIIENHGAFDTADIVFITDDGGRISSNFLKSFNEFRNATQTKVISLSLTMRSEVIETFSDKVVFGFDDLANLTF